MANSITPAMIRLFMLDRHAADNFLLDDQEYSAEELDLAQRLTVSKYNTTSPIGVDDHTVATFPYEYEYLIGVCSILLKCKALNMVRNRINYTTKSGVTVDEKKSAEDYLRLAQAYAEEFDKRISIIKQHLNIEGAYSNLPSQFRLISGTF